MLPDIIRAKIFDLRASVALRVLESSAQSLKISLGQTRKRRENYSGVPRDKETIELFKKLSGTDPLRAR